METLLKSHRPVCNQYLSQDTAPEPEDKDLNQAMLKAARRPIPVEPEGTIDPTGQRNCSSWKIKLQKPGRIHRATQQLKTTQP